MPNNIANVTVPAPVIQLKNDLYLENGQYAPRTLNIPCGINAWVDDIQHWVVPIQDYGICTNVFFQPAVGDYPPGTPPTPDSLLVLRVRDKYYPSFVWWVICTKEQYYNACEACCGDEEIPIPDPTLPVIVPCQEVCNTTNSEGEYISVWGIPELPEGDEYIGHAYYNGEALPEVSGSSVENPLSDIESEWGTIGSPSIEITWTTSEDGLTLIGTGFNEDDVICVLITTTPASP